MDTNQLDEEQLYYKAKYFKYKLKYVALKKQLGGFISIDVNAIGKLVNDPGKALNDLGGVFNNIGAQAQAQVQARPLTAVEKLAIIDQEKALKKQQQKEKDNNDRIRSNAIQAERKAQEKLDDMEKRENIKKQNLITAKNKLIIQYLVDCFNNNRYNTGTRKIVRLANEEKSKMSPDHFINFNAFQKLSDITLPLYDNQTNVDLLIDKIISSGLLNEYVDVQKKKSVLKAHLSNSVKVYIQQNQEIIDKAK
jgi:hypothetical protein